MSVQLVLLSRYTPRCVRWLALRALYRATAEAFGAEMPATRGLSVETILQRYAESTRAWADERLRAGGDLTVLENGLYHRALTLGAQLRRWLGVRGVRDEIEAARLLYGWIGITLAGAATGKVTISRCFFSAYYAPAVCRVMSALDRGILAGLSGGRPLTFTARITEGATCCRAHWGPRETEA
ncbi:MAG: hypothetical protein ACYC4R_06030 [Anaerolineae bacterium]